MLACQRQKQGQKPSRPRTASGVKTLANSARALQLALLDAAVSTTLFRARYYQAGSPEQLLEQLGQRRVTISQDGSTRRVKKCSTRGL